jgi:hypothetical protein
MGEGQHKIKRKAEQIACNEAINFIKSQEPSKPLIPENIVDE